MATDSSDKESYSSLNIIGPLNATTKNRWFTALQRAVTSVGKEHALSRNCAESGRIEITEYDGVGTEVKKTIQNANGQVQTVVTHYWSQDKSEQWKKDNAWLGLRIANERVLSSIDLDLVDNIADCKDMVAALRSKYFRNNAAAGASQIQLVTNFKSKISLSIEENWALMQREKRLAAEFVKGTTFGDDLIFLMFQNGLPDAFKTTINSLNTNTNLDIEGKLEILQDYWISIPAADKVDPPETAHFTSEHAFIGATDSDNETARMGKCYICRSNDHGARTCPYKRASQRFAEQLRLKDERRDADRGRGRSSSSRYKNDWRPRSASRSAPRARSSTRDHVQDALTTALAAIGYSDDEDGGVSVVGTTDGEGDDDSIIEISHASVEARSKTPQSHWIADTACTSHMTDKPELFRGPVRKCTRAIKVGGGRLYSEHIGTVEIEAMDGSKMLLEDCLYVPDLGANLLSARKMCAGGLFGGFDMDSMVFIKDQTLVMECTIHYGVFVLTTINEQVVEHGLSASEIVVKSFADVKNGCSRALQPRKRVTFADENTYEHISYPAQDIDIEGDESETYNIDDEPRIPIGPQLYKANRNKVTRDKRPKVLAEEDPLTGERREVRKHNVRARFMLMHRRFGHASPKILSMLHTVTDIPEIKIPRKIPVCGTCARTKMKKRRSTKLAEHKEQPLALVSLDVAGPFPVSYRGYRYFAQLLDNYTRRSWILLLKHKDDLYKELDEWVVFAERESGHKLLCTRTDNAPEILKYLLNWKRKDGVKVQVTEAYTSSQNGPAERYIQYSENNIRAMIDDGQVPVEFWCEAAKAQCYEVNRTCRGPVVTKKEVLPDGSVQEFQRQISPQEAWDGKQPVATHIKTWGCKAYASVSRKSQPPGARTDHLIPIGRDCVLMGYSEDTDKHYRVYAPDLHTTVLASTVRFDETKPGGSIDNFRLWMEMSDGSFVESPGTPNVLPVRNPKGRPASTVSQITANAMKPPPIAFQSPAFRKPGASLMIDSFLESSPATSTAPSGPQKETEPEAGPAVPTPEPSDGDLPMPDVPVVTTIARHPDPTQWRLPSDEPIGNVAPGRYSLRDQPKRSYAELEDEDEEALEEQRSKRQRAMIAMLDWFDEEFDEDLTEIALVAATTKGLDMGIKIPQSYKEAMASPQAQHWKKAIAYELEQLLINQTWRGEVPPSTANLISTKWVFTLKFHADGRLDRFKARLVARGFSQTSGIDFNETFAPTVRMATLRAFFAIVACEDLLCEHYDIKNAFTESELQHELYLSVPEGVENVKKGHALRLLRSLYGLKQAARDWNQLMKGELLSWGFVQSKGDPCLYVHPVHEIKLLVYVDDIAAAAKQQSALDWFFDKLDKRFTAKNLGEIQKILGIRVTRNRKEFALYLDQEQYLDHVLTKYGYEHSRSKPIATPIDDYKHLRPANSKDKRIDASRYREIVGSLMYAMIYTRIDIAFILGRLSQFMQDPAEHHGQALRRLMRYLRSTISLRIRFGRGKAISDDTLRVYSDADYAADKTDRKSITAFVGLVGGGPIFWGSKKQNSVSTATTEAEYMAMCTTAKQGQWMAQVLRDMGYPEYIAPNGTTVDMRGDNQGAIALAKNPVLSDRSKHIEVQYHYVRELQDCGKANVSFVPTDKMIADALSKPVQKPLLERFIKSVGMVFWG